MSILVLQVIIKQWDKSQRTQQHIEDRDKIPNHYPINFPPAFYAFDKSCVLDQHGDDRLGNRISYSQSDNDTIQFDRFQVGLSDKRLDYIGPSASDLAPRVIGSIDNRWIQCRYDWRYSVYEGGFYYWLYEEVMLNAMYVNMLNENVFINSKPESIFDDLV